MACRRDEAERQDAIGAHRRKRAGDGLVLHPGSLHEAQIAEQGEATQLVLGDQTLEGRALVLAGRELDLPGVGRRKRAIDELLPDLLLGRILRLGMGQEQNVPDPHRAVAVILGELIGVELGQRLRQALLRLGGDGLALALLHRPQRLGPVDGEELGQLVRPLDDALQRVGDEAAMGGAARHLADDQAAAHGAASWPRGPPRRVPRPRQARPAGRALPSARRWTRRPHRTGPPTGGSSSACASAPRRA